MKCIQRCLRACSCRSPVCEFLDRRHAAPRLCPPAEPARCSSTLSTSVRRSVQATRGSGERQGARVAPSAPAWVNCGVAEAGRLPRVRRRRPGRAGCWTPRRIDRLAARARACVAGRRSPASGGSTARIGRPADGRPRCDRRAFRGTTRSGSRRARRHVAGTPRSATDMRARATGARRRRRCSSSLHAAVRRRHGCRQSARSRPGLVIHATRRPVAPAVAGGLPITPPLRTLLDLAPALHPRERDRVARRRWSATS